jgi:hypothetical protein
LNYTSGAWKSVGVCPPAGGAGIQRPGGGVFFSRASTDGDDEGSTQISVAIDCDDGQFRIAVLDQQSHEHPADESDSDESHLKSAFPVFKETFRLPLREIKEFRLQMRPWTKIEFRNVSLHRGQKTNFDVFVDGKSYEPKAGHASH